MRLHAVRLLNFRAYDAECTIVLPRLAALVGRNDVGKSTIFDALGIFFGHELCKIEAADRCVHVRKDENVGITCVFADLPEELVLDRASKTTLKEEWLLNEEGLLEIKKVYRGDRMKEEIFAVARHPTAGPAKELFLKTNGQLRTMAENLKVRTDDLSDVELRRAIRDATGELAPERIEIPLENEGGKAIWRALGQHLPLFALFRSDRASTDQDGEIQDPMRLAVQQALAEVAPQLAIIQEQVGRRATEIAKRALAKLTGLDEKLASTLSPRFRAEPKWDGLFKLSLTGDYDVPINKRGSGVRRLILLSFLQAEVERRRATENIANVIYAIEEPETAQHPNNQVAVMEALTELVATPGCQVLLTTHVPTLAGLVSVDGILHVTQDAGQRRMVGSGSAIVEAIADDLGVRPDPQDRRAQVLLCVASVAAASFFQHVSGAIRSIDPSLPDIGMDPRIAVVPLGADTLKVWVNKRHLRKLGLPMVHIYGSKDEAKNREVCAEVSARGESCTLSAKRELENYLHPVAIRAAFGVDVVVTDTCDVEADVNSALKNRPGLKSTRRCLFEDAAANMTAAMFSERDGLDEIVGWYRKVGSYLRD